MTLKGRQETAGQCIETLLRGITNTPRGKMKIQRAHVNRAIHTNAGRTEIGPRRADKVWAWVATVAERGAHDLKDKTTWKQEWISPGEREVLIAKGAAAWEEVKGQASQEAEQKEMEGATRTWLKENEEQPRSGPMRIRPQKLTQLMGAKKKMAKTRGGNKAIYATLVLLAAKGEVAMMSCPKHPAREGPWTTWIEDMTTWMVERGWITSTEHEGKIMSTAQAAHEESQAKHHTVVDIGEGWRGVGNAISKAFPEVEVVGVDRRGFTNTGAARGVITSAVEHDFSVKGKQDVLLAIAKKVGKHPKRWLMAWISPECSALSKANVINQTKGAAHGKWAITEKNKRNATQARMTQEEDLYEESKAGIGLLLEALMAHPTLKFALENPAQSELWEMQVVIEAIAANPSWRKIRVDQCAFGRKSQKPTCILTNIENWAPKGMTGTGRCKVGECAGTRGNKTGQRDHQEQTVPNSKAKRPDQGEKTGGRRDHTREAVVNAVAEDLVKEIVGTMVNGAVGSPRKREWEPEPRGEVRKKARSSTPGEASDRERTHTREPKDPPQGPPTGGHTKTHPGRYRSSSKGPPMGGHTEDHMGPIWSNNKGPPMGGHKGERTGQHRSRAKGPPRGGQQGASRA